MLRTAVRGTTAVVGSLLTLGLLAVPATADVVPSGCVGSVAYACTGHATPADPVGIYEGDTVTFGAPGQVVFPGTTVDGVWIDSVVVPVGGQTVGPYDVGVGPVRPITVVQLPVGVCAFVVCYSAGTSFQTPGVPLPTVPVYIPAATVPAETVSVPGTYVPSTEVERLTTPAVDIDLVTLSLYFGAEDVDALAWRVCLAGGGVRNSSGECNSGLTAVLANAIHDLV